MDLHKLLIGRIKSNDADGVYRTLDAAQRPEELVAIADNYAIRLAASLSEEKNTDSGNVDPKWCRY